MSDLFDEIRSLLSESQDFRIIEAVKPLQENWIEAFFRGLKKVFLFKVTRVMNSTYLKGHPVAFGERWMDLDKYTIKSGSHQQDGREFVWALAAIPPEASWAAFQCIKNQEFSSNCIILSSDKDELDAIEFSRRIASEVIPEKVKVHKSQESWDVAHKRIIDNARGIITDFVGVNRSIALSAINENMDVKYVILEDSAVNGARTDKGASGVSGVKPLSGYELAFFNK